MQGCSLGGGIIVGRSRRRCRDLDMGLESKNGIAEGGIGRVREERERAPKVMWKPAIRMQSEKRGLLRGNKRSNDRARS